MKNIKKIIAGVTACLTLATLTGCNTHLTWSAKSGETEYAPGVYLYQVINAYNQAYYYDFETDEQKANPFDQEIDGVSLEQYIIDYSQDAIKELFVLEQEFAAQGLEFTEEDQTDIENNADYYWDTLGESFENAGISKESFELCTKIEFYKSELLADYKEEQGVDEEFLAGVEATVLEENEIANGFVVYTTDDAGVDYDDAKKAEMKTKAEGYVERIIDGEDIAEIYDEYMLEEDETYAPTEEELAEEDRLTILVSEESTIFTPEQVAVIFDEMEVGDVQIFEFEYGYAIIEKLEFSENETMLDELVVSEAEITRNEEYQAILDGKKAEISVEFNQGVIDTYSPKSVIEDYQG